MVLFSDESSSAAVTGKQKPDSVNPDVSQKVKKNQSAARIPDCRCYEAPPACGSVAAGVGASLSVMAVTFLSSSS